MVRNQPVDVIRKETSVESEAPCGGGGDPHMKRTEMLVVSIIIRGAIFGFRDIKKKLRPRLDRSPVAI